MARTGNLRRLATSSVLAALVVAVPLAQAQTSATLVELARAQQKAREDAKAAEAAKAAGDAKAPDDAKPQSDAKADVKASAAPKQDGTSRNAAWQPVKLVNPGFESLVPGVYGNPEGWVSVQHAGQLSYTFTLDTSVHRSGLRSVRMDNVGPEPWGVMMQSLPAAELQSRRVRFAAWLRSQDAKGMVYLQVQAKRHGSPLTLSNTRDTPIQGTRGWSRASVEFDVPANAEFVEVSVVMQGPGRAWIDDVELSVFPS